MITVLLVDDNEVSRRAMRKLLLSHGIAVLEASGAVMAMACLRTSAPIDLVITDISMPEVDGVELLERVRRAAPGTPVIAMTGYPRSSVDHAGFDEVLDKPVILEDLIGAITRTLGSL